MDTNNNMQKPEMNNTSGGSKKGVWVVVIVILIILLAIMLGGKNRRDNMMVPPADNTPTEEMPVQGETATGVNEEPATSPAATLSYTNALKQYAGKILQFDGGCQVVPADSPVYKAGASIMLDNRSNVARTVKIGSTSYSIGSYGFRIATLSTAGTFKIDCGTAQNVTTLTVVK